MQGEGESRACQGTQDTGQSQGGEGAVPSDRGRASNRSCFPSFLPPLNLACLPCVFFSALSTTLI